MIQKNDIKEASLIERYNEGKKKALEQFGLTYSRLNKLLKQRHVRRTCDNPLPMTGDAFIDSLLNIPDAVVDSLYNVYCSNDADTLHDTYYDILTSVLSQLSSENETVDLIQFCHSYYNMGGNDMAFIANYCQGRTPVITDCIIRCAAIIDDMLSVLCRQLDPAEECFRKLIESVTLMMCEGATEDAIYEALAGSLIIIPELEIIPVLIMAGLDIDQAVRIAHDYVECLKNS